MAQAVENLPSVQETQVRSLGREDPLEKGMTTHSSILAWRISMDRGAWWDTVHGVAKSQTRLSDYHLHLCETTTTMPKEDVTPPKVSSCSLYYY